LQEDLALLDKLSRSNAFVTMFIIANYPPTIIASPTLGSPKSFIVEIKEREQERRVKTRIFFLQ
jgi:hypothetical protein